MTLSPQALYVSHLALQCSTSPPLEVCGLLEDCPRPAPLTAWPSLAVLVCCCGCWSLELAPFPGLAPILAPALQGTHSSPSHIR